MTLHFTIVGKNMGSGSSQATKNSVPVYIPRQTEPTVSHTPFLKTGMLQNVYPVVHCASCGK